MKATVTTCAWAIGAALWSSTVWVHAQPVTEVQRATAQQVAQQGVPVTALAASAPESYIVQPGDTLWRIAGVFLQQPWQWPALWGMNMQAIANPHLIYPGQVLYLERSGGFARLSTSRTGETATVKLSPRVRSNSLADMALPTLQMHLIETFFSEPLVLTADTLAFAPRIMGSSDERVLLGQGDRVYARGSEQEPLQRARGESDHYRLFRQAVPLLDPVTKEVLGYEAQYLGKALLERGESAREADAEAGNAAAYIPATVQIVQTKEEIRAGDRLLPEPERQFQNFVPHAAQAPIQARVASLYGNNSVRYGTQHQVVAINKGAEDGVVPGMVLALITKGRTIVDKTDPQRATVQLPDEENGMGMVFRSFDRVSYVLIMDVQRGVQVGDLLTNPR